MAGDTRPLSRAGGGGECTLAAVLAHPDDESRIIGGTLALHASRGDRVALYCATRGEAGDAKLSRERVAMLRERELEEASRVLRLTTLRLGHFPDGGVAAADTEALIEEIVAFVRAERPQVVITFGPDGRTGHPDHVAVGASAELAFARAGDARFHPEHLAQGLRPWQPARLYHTAVADSVASRIDWRHPSFPDEDLVAVDVSSALDRKRRAAVEAHASQWALSPFNLAAGWEPFAVEHFRLVRQVGAGDEVTGEDLFWALP